VGDGVFEVKSTSGDTHLGGDDFDQVIIDYIATEFKNEQGVDLKQDKQALQRLKEASEKAKKELSTKTETEVNIPYITADQTGPKHLQVKLSRAKLEQLVDGLVSKTYVALEKALKDAGLKKEEINEVVLVGGQTRMPYIQQKVTEFFGKEPHKGVNPDEVVAIGAAIQAGVLGGEVKDVLLLDVTPLTLGIETLGGVSTPLIERNTTIPAAESQVFSTAADNQTSVEINVLQGERPMATDNKSLGKFILSGIPPAPRGIPQVEVTFDIDANGILNVSAVDKATNTKQQITIQNTTDLSADEVKRMKQEAEMNAQEDLKKKEHSETINQADTLLYTAEKTLKDGGDKISEEQKSTVQTHIDELRQAMSGEDFEVIKTKTESLSKAIQEVGAAMYQNTTQEETADSSNNTSEPTGDESSESPTEEPVEGTVVDDTNDTKN